MARKENRASETAAAPAASGRQGKRFEPAPEQAKDRGGTIREPLKNGPSPIIKGRLAVAPSADLNIAY